MRSCGSFTYWLKKPQFEDLKAEHGALRTLLLSHSLSAVQTVLLSYQCSGVAVAVAVTMYVIVPHP